MMHISQRGLDLIKEFESYLKPLQDGRCTTYLCPAGVPTIGWGCTKGIKVGDVWTREQAEDGLRRELAKSEAAVTRRTGEPHRLSPDDARRKETV